MFIATQKSQLDTAWLTPELNLDLMQADMTATGQQHW